MQSRVTWYQVNLPECTSYDRWEVCTQVSTYLYYALWSCLIALAYVLVFCCIYLPFAPVLNTVLFGYYALVFHLYSWVPKKPGHPSCGL